MADEAANEANTGRQTFCGPMEGRPESATARGETERLDIEGDVEACRQEILRAPGPTEKVGAKTSTRESG